MWPSREEPGPGPGLIQGGREVTVCWITFGSKQTLCYCPWLDWAGLCGAVLVQRIKMFPCLLSSLEQGVGGDGDYPQVWTRNSPPGTSSEELHLRMLE